MDAVDQLAPTVGIESRLRCARRGPRILLSTPGVRAQALSGIIRAIARSGPEPEERAGFAHVLNSERFQDCAPAAVQATLLDEGQYLCSTRTMYRVSGTRRRHAANAAINSFIRAYQKPELLATAPNRVLELGYHQTARARPSGPTSTSTSSSMFSAATSSAGWSRPAKARNWPSKFIEETCDKQIIPPGQLTIHADRGSSMRSKPVAFLLADLGITKTHSRPYVSNDNPVFGKPVPDPEIPPRVPGSLRLIQDARAFCQTFFPWYNDEHRAPPPSRSSAMVSARAKLEAAPVSRAIGDTSGRGWGNRHRLKLWRRSLWARQQAELGPAGGRRAKVGILLVDCRAVRTRQLWRWKASWMEKRSG